MESQTLISRNYVPVSDVTCSVNISLSFSRRPVCRPRRAVLARFGDSRTPSKVPVGHGLLFVPLHGPPRSPVPSRKLIGRKLDISLIIKWSNVRSSPPCATRREIFAPATAEFRLAAFYLPCYQKFSPRGTRSLLRER